MNDNTACRDESLRTQLAELNARSRAYTARMWQVPFAYVGILAVVLAQVVDKSAGIMGATFLFGGVIGTAVIVHMFSLKSRIKRVIGNISTVEDHLGLEETAKYAPGWHIGSLIAIVVISVVSSYIAAGYYFCCAAI